MTKSKTSLILYVYICMYMYVSIILLLLLVTFINSEFEIIIKYIYDVTICYKNEYAYAL